MSESKTFPANWLIAQDYEPNEHTMNLKGKAYLDVQNRLLWFIRDQRALIAAGLAVMPYIIRTECIEHDREAKWANYRTYVRDVLGNECTMEGSEAAKDFPDYLEKASTKSEGRALVGLGYGTGMAADLDEGERVVDSPRQQPRQPQHQAQAQRQPPQQQRPQQQQQPAQQAQAQAAGAPTPQQLVAIDNLSRVLDRPLPNFATLTQAQAQEMIIEMNAAVVNARKAKEARV